MKRIAEILISWFGFIWIMLSPFAVVASSVLTTIKWYALSNSIIQGIAGFVLGGLAGGFVMGIGLVILLMLYYLVQSN